MAKILYLGWLGHQNIGDELMYDLFREKFREKADTTKYKLIPSTRKVLRRLKRNKPYLQYFDSIVLGGGSLFVPDLVNILFRAVKWHKNIRIFIWGSGIDWLEKRELIRLGLQTEEEINWKNEFKIFKDPYFKIKLQAIFQHAQFIGIRGHYTHQFFQSKGYNLEKVKVTGDPGLLVHMLQELPENKDSKKVVINWGTAYQRLYGRNEAKLEQEMVDVMKKLVEMGYDVYIYPIWVSDLAPCKSLYNKIEDKRHVHLITELLDQYGILNLIKDAKFTINFKLHANVLSATAGIPFVALGYRFKTFDFANSIGLDNLVVSTDETHFSEQILSKVSNIENHEGSLLQNLPAYQLQVEKDLEQVFEYFK
jgi:Polysaccharide pyruvyl transferase